MTTTSRRVNLNNCTHEQLFKAISKIQAKAAAIFVKYERRIRHHMKHMTDMAEHYFVNDNDNFSTSHLKFTNFFPNEFGATKDYWEEKGIPPRRLLNGTYTCPHTGNQTQDHQTMSGDNKS